MFLRKNFPLLGLLLVVLFLPGCKSTDNDAISGASLPFDPNGNSMYHQSAESALQTGKLQILGEVKTPGEVDLNQFYKREVVLREGKYLNDGTYDFVGAYRYSGYSLFDLLHPFIHQKKNKDEFPSAIDLYVVVENTKGETVTLSWGEIFYSINSHQILIATESAPIKPYKKEVDYPVGKEWKLVVASDLYSNRQLTNPIKITVKSFDKKELVIDREIAPLFSSELVINLADTMSIRINDLTKADCEIHYNTIFYGMGMGHHPNPGFHGITLDKVMDKYLGEWPVSWLRNGLVCFVGLDGFRTVYSISELFSRADLGIPILQITDDLERKGKYRIFNPSDFFADRSVKSLAEMYIFTE